MIAICSRQTRRAFRSPESSDVGGDCLVDGAHGDGPRCTAADVAVVRLQKVDERLHTAVLPKLGEQRRATSPTRRRAKATFRSRHNRKISFVSQKLRLVRRVMVTFRSFHESCGSLVVSMVLRNFRIVCSTRRNFLVYLSAMINIADQQIIDDHRRSSMNIDEHRRSSMININIAGSAWQT